MGAVNRKKSSLFLIIIFLILFISVIIVVLSLRTDNVAEALVNDQVLRVLFVVQDEDGSVLFSNVLIYYPVYNRAALVSIPGNTGAIYKTIGRVDRIDAVYKARGVSSYCEEINSMLDMKIPFTVEITFDNFIKFIDLIGGVKIFIPEPIDIAHEDGSRWLLPSGAVNLDGDKAVAYLSYGEKYDSDTNERCQNMMTAIFTSMADKRSVIFSGLNFTFYNDCVNVNLNYDDTYRLFSMISEINTEYIIKQTVAGMNRSVDGKTLLFPLNNGDLIKQVMNQTTSMIVSMSGTMAGRVYVLEVQNGTTVQGLARNTQVLFENAGYDVLRAVNAEHNDYANTIIVDHIGNRDAALTVGDFIRCTNIEEESIGKSGDADVDFTIILGRDFDGRYVRVR